MSHKQNSIHYGNELVSSRQHEHPLGGDPGWLGMRSDPSGPWECEVTHTKRRLCAVSCSLIGSGWFVCLCLGNVNLLSAFLCPPSLFKALDTTSQGTIYIYIYIYIYCYLNHQNFVLFVVVVLFLPGNNDSKSKREEQKIYISKKSLTLRSFFKSKKKKERERHHSMCPYYYFQFFVYLRDDKRRDVLLLELLTTPHM
eukprot:gene8925-6261_t